MSKMSMQDYARLGESLGNAYGTYKEQGLRNREQESFQQYTPEQAQEMETAQGLVNPETGQPYYDVLAKKDGSYEFGVRGAGTSEADSHLYGTMVPQTQYRLGGLTREKEFSPEEVRTQNEADIREQWKSQGTYGQGKLENYNANELRGLQTEALKNELGVKKEEQIFLKSLKTEDSFLTYLNDKYPDDNAYVKHTGKDGITHIIQDNADGNPSSVAKYKDWATDGTNQAMLHSPRFAADSWKMQQEQRDKMAQIDETGKWNQKAANTRADASKAAQAGLKLIGVTKDDSRPVYSDRNGSYVFEPDAEGNPTRVPYLEKDVVKMGLGAKDSGPMSEEKWATINGEVDSAKYKAYLASWAPAPVQPSREAVLAKINRLPSGKRAAALAQYESASGRGAEKVVEQPPPQGLEVVYNQYGQPDSQLTFEKSIRTMPPEVVRGLMKDSGKFGLR